MNDNSVIAARSDQSGLRKRKTKAEETAEMVPKAHVDVLCESESYSDGSSSKMNKQTKNYDLEAKTSLKDGHTELNYETTNFSEETSTSNYLHHYNENNSVNNTRHIHHGGTNNSDSDGSDDFSNDRTALISPTRLKKAKSSDHRMVDFDNLNVNTSTAKKESIWTVAMQIMFPFLMAGMGMVAAGVVLDKVQHWKVFEKVPEIFILVPALLGLKGNLEMTLASRVSTYANKGMLDDRRKMMSIVWGNMVLVEAQAMVVAFLASLVAIVFGWIPDGKWEMNHAIILCAGSLLTGAIASCLLGLVMIAVIIGSRKLGINPDNVATPIAASLGDLITLSLLSAIVKGLFLVLNNPSTSWIGPAIIILFILLTPILLWLAHRNEYTREVVKYGWEPVIMAMVISSTGGFILDFALLQNPGVAVFAPVINGVGGNLVAVQASRISTHLHSSGLPLGTLPPSEAPGCVTPCYSFFGSNNPHAGGARVMWLMVIPGQLIFLLTIEQLQAGHTSITPQFVAVYLLISLIQVAILLHVCQWLVIRLWRKEDDPDNSAIPYLTALGDLLGTGLLAGGFLFLWLVGDRDADVGDK